MDAARAAALQATLGEEQMIVSGSPLPPFYHQLYFWEARAPAALGRDGHPAIGGLIPDFGLPRRMWAGGRLLFYAPLLTGIPARKTTRLAGTSRKTGRSGALAFVTLRHDIHQSGALCVTEFQDLVYREDPAPDLPQPHYPMAPTDETIREDFHFDSTLLFRYSALTFNGHRIHYDLEYTRHVEGYKGLVVHGPLLAHLLMRMAARQLGTLKSFSFRATAPLMQSEPASLCWKPGAMWAKGPDGRQIMAAHAT